jgi:uncharacterized membrane protein YfcA
MDLALFVLCILIGFISQYMDVSVGMGYGTFTAPLLLLLGIPPPVAVSAILLSKTILGLLSGGGHQMAGNVQHKILLPLVLTGIGGTACGVALSIILEVPEVKALIGLIMMMIGFLTLFHVLRGVRMGAYSENKIRVSGFLAGFTNGVSGGGYGAINTTGLILGGVDPSAAIGSTLLSEAAVALFGMSLYWFLLQGLRWEIIFPLLIGGIVATPIGILTTRNTSSRKLGATVGLTVLFLGALSAIRSNGMFVSGFVLIVLILIAYHLVMIGILRLRVAVGGANIGVGCFMLLVSQLIRSGFIKFDLPSFLLYGLVSGGVICILAGILNVTAS